MKSKINIPVGVALFVALALLALSAVVTLPQLSPSLVFGQAAETPLQPPTSLTAVLVGQKSIALVWTPPPSADNATTVYMVERSEDGSTGWARVVPPAANATVRGTTYNDNDSGMPLELSTKYYYRVSTITDSPDRKEQTFECG